MRLLMGANAATYGRKCGDLWAKCTGLMVHLHRIGGAFVPDRWSICSTVGFMCHRNEGQKVGPLLCCI